GGWRSFQRSGVWRFRGACLSFEEEFGSFVADVDVKLVACGVDPETVAFARERDRGGAVDDGEGGGLDTLAEFGDEDVGVALGAALETVDGERPCAVGPELSGFGDGEGPVGFALGGGHVGEVLGVGT